MDLRQLEYLVAVADAGTFTGAARALFTVQSGVSVAIANLEHELGTEIVTRAARGVTLTEAGRLMLERAREILAMVEDAKDAVEELAGGLRGVVRVGIMHLLMSDEMARALAEFKRERPQVKVSLRTDPSGSQGLLDAVRSGELDLALAGFGPNSSDGLLATTISQESIRLVVPAGHWLAGRRRVSLPELVDEPFVDLPTGWGSRAAVDDAFTVAGLRRRLEIEVGDVTTVMSLVAAGLGIALLAPSSGPQHVEIHSIAVTPRISFTVGLALPANRRISAAAAAVHQSLTRASRSTIEDT